ncbi:MAG: hypothetical protein N4A68_04390 [Maledivibacter sp.]|jgi:hypothetical protein|nr:hypothetical protein [Maledivibacter sp.]
MKDRMKYISVVAILLIVAIALGYGIYQRLQPTTQINQIDSEVKKQLEVNVEDIEQEEIVDVPEIQNSEQNQEVKEENSNDEIILDIDEPKVPPVPESPEKESGEESVEEITDTEVELIPESEDTVKKGDEEENPEPPKYDEPPKTEETEQPENPVVVTPKVPQETDDKQEENVVPDSENPFLKPPSEVPSNGNRGGVDGKEHSDYDPNTGDKF